MPTNLISNSKAMIYIVFLLQVYHYCPTSVLNAVPVSYICKRYLGNTYHQADKITKVLNDMIKEVNWWYFLILERDL